MGIFNNINEKTLKKKQNKKYVVFNIININAGGLFSWIVGESSSSLIQNGNKVTIKQNCTLIIVINAIKVQKGKTELLLKDKDSRLINSYTAENNRRNESISVNYADRFKTDDEIYIDGLNVKKFN